MIVRIVIPITPEVTNYANTIVQKWAGYTRTTLGLGGWLGPRGVMVEEPVTIFDVHVGDDTPARRKWWVQFADRIRLDLDQEAVYLQFSAAEVLFVEGGWDED